MIIKILESSSAFVAVNADLIPHGVIWTPFCPDLDQPISRPGTPSQSHADVLTYGFIWTPSYPDLDQAYFRAQVHPPEAKRIWIDGRRATSPLST